MRKAQVVVLCSVKFVYVILTIIMTSNSSKNVFLDVDPTIVEKNLCFATNPTEEEFNKLFQAPGEQYPSKLVKPFPDFSQRAQVRYWRRQDRHRIHI